MRQLLVVLFLLVTMTPMALRAQCAVDLGADTSLCAASYTIHPGLSISTFEDSLEIVYDATQGQTGLVGATKVYMHSAAEMVPFGGWQNVVGNWGQDDGIGQMTNIGSNLWRIRLVPHVYYGYPVNVTPNGLFMVFRNASGTATGKDANGNDIWANMTTPVPASSFGGVQFRWITDALDSLHWSDGSNGPSLTVNGPGTYWVTMADTGGCMASDTVVVTLGSIPLVDLGQPAICDGVPAVLDAGAGYAQYAWSTGATTQTISLSTPGLVVVTVTNAAGCTGIDVVNVPASSAPTAAFTASVTGLTVQFVDGSTYGTTYAWDWENNGSTDASTPGTTSHTYPSAGTYTVSLIVSNFCGTDTFLQTLTVGAVGIDEGFGSKWSFYPNPANDHITLDFDGITTTEVKWVILDAQGRQWLGSSFTSDGVSFRENVDIQALPAGLYWVALRADGRQAARSFLKQ